MEQQGTHLLRLKDALNNYPRKSKELEEARFYVIINGDFEDQSDSLDDMEEFQKQIESATLKYIETDEIIQFRYMEDIHLKSLTLEGIYDHEWVYRPEKLIDTLTIIDCRMEIDNLSLLCENSRSITLKDVAIVDEQEYVIDALKAKSLSVDNCKLPKVEWEVPALKKLCFRGDMGQIIDDPPIEELQLLGTTLDSPIAVEKFRTIKKLIIPFLDISPECTHFVNYFSGLQSLEVCQSVDPLKKTAIMDMLSVCRSLTEKKLHFWHIPSDSEKNILILNHDCIHHILDQLETRDRILFGAADAHLWTALKSYKGQPNELKIDEESFKSYSTRTLKTLGLMVDHLSCTQMSENVFYKIIVCFPRLTSLHVQNVTLKRADWVDKFPKSLEEIFDHSCEQSSGFRYPFLRAFCTKFADRLKILDSVNDVRDAHTLCTKLTHVYWSDPKKAPPVEWLEKLKPTLTHLVFLQWNQDFTVPVLENLKYLELARDARKEAIRCLQPHQFPNLEEAYISDMFVFDYTTPDLLKKLPTTIKKLTIPHRSEYFALIAKRFKDLEELNFTGLEHSEEGYLKWLELKPLQKLKKLSCQTSQLLRVLVQLLRLMPNLEDIQGPFAKAYWTGFSSLLQLLIQTKRRLRINDFDFSQMYRNG